MKKINLLHISMVLLITIVLVFLMYQYTSCKPKKIEIDENIEIEKLPESDHIVQEINDKSKKIICALETEKLFSEDYYNYVSGKGTGKKANCSILLKVNEKYYEIKTLLEGNTQTPKVNFVGFIKNKYLQRDYELLLFDKDKKKIYMYTGETSEGNS